MLHFASAAFTFTPEINCSFFSSAKESSHTAPIKPSLHVEICFNVSHMDMGTVS